MRAVKVVVELTTAVAACAALVGVASAQTQPADPNGWQQIGEEITSGISGLAVARVSPNGYSAYVVRDNKNPDENRLARIDLDRGRVTAVEPVQWNGQQPLDLEALEQYPSSAGDEFIALDSTGNGFHIRVHDRQATVLRTFHLPKGQDGDNYESFAMTAIGNRVVAVWADRGQDERPATLYAAVLDLPTLTFGPTATATVRVPYPTQHVRHVSDIEITATGVILASAASDPGNDGPFDSALYSLGRVRMTTHAGFALRPEPALEDRFPEHKVEAIDCLNTHCRSLVLGTDDESAGGSIRIR